VIASSSTVVGVQIDGAFDFTDISDYDWFCPSGISANSIALQIGRVDGINLRNPKIFNANISINFNQPATDTIQPFGTISSPMIDSVNLGIVVAAPTQHLPVTGGFIRSIGRSLTIDNPAARVAVSGVSLLSQADHTIQALDFEQLTVVGNNFASDYTYDTAPFVYVQISGDVGDGRYYVGDNSCDGKHPMVYADASAHGGTIGPNNWPGAQYTSADMGYVSSPNLSVNHQLPTTGGQATIAASASDYLLPHGLNCQPWMPRVDLIGESAAGPYKAVIVASDITNLTVRIVNTETGATVTTGTFTAVWQA
jgi:hypothetical protein